MSRLLLCALAFALAGTSALASAVGPTLAPVAFEKAFVPVGFDDNDVSQIVIAGHFPDTCHKLGPTRTRVDAVTGVVWVEQTAYQYSDICLRMLVPFSQVVNIGLLRAGTHAIADVTTGKLSGEIPVLVSKNPGPDDYLYAPVTDSDIVPSGKPGVRQLVVRGNFTNRCTKLKEVRIEYQKEVLVVQPIAEYTGPRDCAYEKLRFEYVQPLDKPLKGTYLLHVRSMSGQAVNKILDLE